MNLEELIEIMSGVRDGEVAQGSETLSWDAYNIARNINDLELLPELQAYLSNASSESRPYVYDLMSFIGKNTTDPQVSHIMLEYLEMEDKFDDNLHHLLSGIYDTGIPLKDKLERMCYYAFDERELIRCTAIQLLARYAEDSGEQIVNTLKEVIQYHYDEWDLKYAVESLRVHQPETYRKTVLTIRKQLEDELSIERIDNVLSEL